MYLALVWCGQEGMSYLEESRERLYHFLQISDPAVRKLLLAIALAGAHCVGALLASSKNRGLLLLAGDFLSCKQLVGL